ncbi:sodium:solute symporter [Hwangdonia sp.]|uniref:sodium:solute symporter n=1 Tax=Hwangdonia sp. TaxID=1883432 RepID=UPI003AB27B66
MDKFVLSNLDLGIIIGYFIFIMILGFFIGKKLKSADDYFLAGRSMIWPFIGVSLFASNISNANLLGLAGEAYESGIAVFNYDWMAVVVLVLFAIFILPIYLKSKMFTLPEYLEKRFDQRSRLYFSALTLVGNIVIEAAAVLYAGALVVQLVFPDIPVWQIVTVLAVVAGAYTISGGLSAVIYTDAIQALLLVMGSVIITVIAYNSIGGVDGIREVATTGTLNLIKPADDKALPWPALIVSLPLLGFYYWTTNQFITQRILSAKSIDHGRWGVLFAGFLKLITLFIMILPGVMARKLYPNLENADLVLPTMIFDLLPQGIIGLVVAGIIAALMSSLDSTLNSASTLVTMDFVHKFKPNLNTKQLMNVGRITTVLFMVFAVLWAPQIAKFDSLFRYLQTMLSYITPPIAAVFLFGLFWKKTTSNAAFNSLLIGMATGIIIFLNNVIFESIDIHFLYVVPVLFTATSLSLIIISLYSKETKKDVEAFIWSREIFNQEKIELKNKKWYLNYRILSIILLIITAILVYIFR